MAAQQGNAYANETLYHSTWLNVGHPDVKKLSDQKVAVLTDKNSVSIARRSPNQTKRVL
jgi:hypothetical protein